MAQVYTPNEMIHAADLVSTDPDRLPPQEPLGRTMTISSRNKFTEKYPLIKSWSTDDHVLSKTWRVNSDAHTDAWVEGRVLPNALLVLRYMSIMMSSQGKCIKHVGWLNKPRLAREFHPIIRMLEGDNLMTTMWFAPPTTHTGLDFIPWCIPISVCTPDLFWIHSIHDTSSSKCLTGFRPVKLYNFLYL